MRKVFVLIFAAVVGFVFMFNNVHQVKAQDASDYEFTLEEITVTAQKREENQQKVPIAMEVFSGEEMKELGRNNIDEILSNVAGVIVNKASDGFRVSIRGISNDLAQFQQTNPSTPTVATNKDGVYTNRVDSGQNLFDIERVEVLFGPQSTLYATTSPGGVVNIVTSAPKTDQYEASGTLEYGNYNLLHTEGMVNAPINETMALRAAFTTTVRDGYISDGSDDEDSKSARLRALYKPNDRLSFMVTGEYMTTAGMGITGVETFDKESDTDDPWTSDTDSSSPNPSGSNHEKKIYANIDWDLGFGDLSIVPSYSKDDYDHTQTAENMEGVVVTSNMKSHSTEKDVEAHLSSPEDSVIDWTIGGNIYRSKDSSDRDSDDGGWEWVRIKQNSEAIYGNMTYPFTDSFRVTGGLRYTSEEHYSGNSKYPDQEALKTGDWVKDITMEFNGMDYKIGVEYDVGSNSMLYSDFSTGHRLQGMTYNSSGKVFPPEKLKSYTVGAKNRFFGNKVQLNASAYYYDYANYIPDCPSVITLDQKDLDGDGDYDGEDLWDEDVGDYRDETITYSDPNSISSGDFEVLGVDIQSSLIFTGSDKLDISVSYQHKEFSDFIFDFIDETNALGIEDVDYSGKGSSNSPDWTITAGYSHNFNLANGGSLTARIDAKYQSEYFLTYIEKSVGLDMETYEATVTYLGGVRIQEAYHTEDFSLIYAQPEGKWTLTGYVKNIENYAVKLSYLASSLVIGAPRTYGGILSVRF